MTDVNGFHDFAMGDDCPTARRSKEKIVQRLEQRRRQDEQQKANSATLASCYDSCDVKSQSQLLNEFETSFYVRCVTLLTDMECGNLLTAEAQRELQSLRLVLAENSATLPGYEMRKAQLRLKEVEEKLKPKVGELSSGRRGFSFTRSAKPKSTHGVATSAAVSEPFLNSTTSYNRNGITNGLSSSDGEAHNRNVVAPLSVSVPAPGCVQVTDRTDASVVLGNECGAADVVLKKLVGCKISISGCPGSLSLHGVKDCDIISMPVSRSIMIDDAVHCNFVVACQQLRIHRASMSTFYIHCTSDPIIEDSSGLKFAPYSLQENRLTEAWKEAKLDPNANRWDNVKDFNWLVSAKSSPNWTVVLEPERKIWSLLQ